MYITPGYKYLVRTSSRTQSASVRKTYHANEKVVI